MLKILEDGEKKATAKPAQTKGTPESVKKDGKGGKEK